MNSLMNWFVENWYLVIFVIVAIFIAYNTIRWFLKLPSSEQLAKVKMWLLQAVVEAEIELGSKTGKAKLATVYNWFTAKFPWTSHLITIEKFEELVNLALDEAKEILEVVKVE